MRAIVTDGIGGPEVLRLADVPTPVAAEGDLLIRVNASGVNRADLMQRRGLYPPPPGASPIIGLEVSGVVAAMGAGVTGWAEGEACVALLAGGGYAEYVVAPAGQVLRPPAGIDPITAAGLIEVAATVISNLNRVGLTAGDVLLVHGGAGGIGSFAIQYGRAVGARVLATAGSDHKREMCRKLGAAAALDYHGDWVTAATEASGGHGADVILDVVGAAYLPQNVEVLAVEGRLVVIGLQGGRRGTLDLGALLAKRGTLTATNLRARSVDQKAAICADVARTVWPRYADGSLRPPAVTRYRADQAAAAHRHLESGHAYGKLILTWN